jgi:hypothetical protein
VAHRGYGKSVKQQALAMYLEGLGFRSIGRLLRCSHVTVYYWIKAYGEKSNLKIAGSEIDVVEMDEMHAYIGSKKKRVGYGLPLTDQGIVFSMSLLVHATQTQVNVSGKVSRITTLGAS